MLVPQTKTGVGSAGSENSSPASEAESGVDGVPRRRGVLKGLDKGEVGGMEERVGVW